MFALMILAPVNVGATDGQQLPRSTTRGPVPPARAVEHSDADNARLPPQPPPRQRPGFLTVLLRALSTWHG